MNCYVCGEELNSNNRSSEHIILNSLGGTLKSRDLICQNCNSTFGEKIDNVLAGQLSFYATMIDVKRDRGKLQKVKLNDVNTGDSFLIGPGGKPEPANPTIEKTTENGEVAKYTIMARSIEEARGIIKGIKRKNPNVDVNQALKDSEIKRKYCNKLQHNVTIGGSDTFRAICKTALNYYIYCGGSPKYIKHLISFIKSGSDDSNTLMNYYYSNEEIIEKHIDQITHSIILIGDNQNKLLYSYVELFNAFRFFILLNDNYDGEKIHEVYCYDLINNKEIEKESSFAIKKIEIDNILKAPIPFDELKRELCRLMDIIMKKQFVHETDEIFNRVWGKMIQKYPDEKVVTEDMSRFFIDEYMKNISPLIIHKLK